MSWTTPKTDWAASDRFNISDYNRIKNNIEWLFDKAEEIMQTTITHNDMGADIVTHTGYRTADDFNKIEQNIDIINNAVFYKDYGAAQTFYANGAFIRYTELNRIESACVGIRDTIENMIIGISNKRLAFVLGQYNLVRP